MYVGICGREAETPETNPDEEGLSLRMSREREMDGGGPNKTCSPPFCCCDTMQVFAYLIEPSSQLLRCVAANPRLPTASDHITTDAAAA